MAGDREELESLRRLAELEARAAATTLVPAESSKPRSFTDIVLGRNMPSMSDEQKRGLAEAQKFGFGSLGNAPYEMGGHAADVATKLHASPEVSGGVGVLANMATQAIPMAVFRGSNPKQLSATEDIPVIGSKAMMQRAVKPAADDIASGSAGRAFSDMLRRDIPATPNAMNQLALKSKLLGSQADELIQASPNTVSVGELGQKFLPQYDRALAKNNIEPVQKVWQNFAGNVGVGTDTDPITVQMANLLKKELYQTIGNKNFGEMKGLETEAQKALAHYLRELEAGAVPKAAPLMAEQSKLMNIMDVVKNRVNVAGNRDLTGLASLRLDDPKVFAAVMSDRSPYLKSLAARIIHQSGRPEVALPAGIAASKVPALFEQE